MPSYRCCVGTCSNDSRYRENIVKRGHVEGELKWHHFPKDDGVRAQWVANISRGIKGFVASNYKTVCSNHFQYGKPTSASPHPTLYLVESDICKQSPRKRRKLVYRQQILNDAPSTKSQTKSKRGEPKEAATQCTIESFTFTQLTREIDVRFFTGFPNTETFEMVFNQLKPKAANMHYWRGLKETISNDDSPAKIARSGRRVMTLEQEFLLTMIRIRIASFQQDLAFRFGISEALVSRIFATWIKLMKVELSWLIVWPERRIIRRNLPEVFRKYYPRCCVVIDCTEFFVATPSSLEAAALLWSNYKHHSTIKVLIGITPNGLISFVSDCYGGRATDKHIVENSSFLQFVQPNDQIMADRGFKIAEMLAFYQCSLAIPPSKCGELQMSKEQVKNTSRIANARIYVEQAMKRLKDYHILSNEIPVTLISLADDIVKVCAALSNLQEPLCKY